MMSQCLCFLLDDAFVAFGLYVSVFRFKGSWFQSTLNRKTRNQPADETKQGIERNKNNAGEHNGNENDVVDDDNDDDN